MVRALPGSLSELIGFGGTVHVKCRKCGREARFSVYDLSRWFRLNGGRDDWKTIRRKFVCNGPAGEGCGGRDVEVTYQLEAPSCPSRRPFPATTARWASTRQPGPRRIIMNEGG